MLEYHLGEPEPCRQLSGRLRKTVCARDRGEDKEGAVKMATCLVAATNCSNPLTRAAPSSERLEVVSRECSTIRSRGDHVRKAEAPSALKWGEIGLSSYEEESWKASQVPTTYEVL